MTINQRILAGIEASIGRYGCSVDQIKHFMGTREFDRRQEMAAGIIEAAMKSHGKSTLMRYLAELARVERGVRELQPWARDHVVHALLTFLLGIYINEHFLEPSGYAVDAFQWKLAALFHDIAYPVQIAQHMERSFACQINGIKRELNLEVPDISVRTIPTGLTALGSGKDSLELIQGRLDRWQLQIDARGEYYGRLESGLVRH